MRPIVCSVDDSDAAEGVVRVAQQLVTALDAKLVLLHVAPPTTAPGVSAMPAGQERLHEEETSDARRLLENIVSRTGASDASLRTEIGSVADRIVDVCKEEMAAFVVLGSRGRGDLKSAVLGSVSNRVASRAPCPVVIVPPASAPVT